MDISLLKPLETVDIQLKHPVTGDALDIVFTVYGTDSKVYRQSLRDIISNSERDLNNDDILLIASCVKYFKNILDGEKEVIFSLESTIEILRDYPWILDQIAVAISNKSNFFLKD